MQKWNRKCAFQFAMVFIRDEIQDTRYKGGGWSRRFVLEIFISSDWFIYSRKRKRMIFKSNFMFLSLNFYDAPF